MAFTANPTTPAKTTIGEIHGEVAGALILTAKSIEDALKVGRFAKLDTGRLDNMDGSAAPVIAGVPVRLVTNAVEDDGTIDADLHTSWEYIRSGLVAVAVKAGETPTKFGRVHVSNAGDASDGMALAAATATSVAVSAEFIEVVDTNVWLVDLSLDVPADDAGVITSATTATALPANRTATVTLTTGGAATRTLANPTEAGLTLSISMSVDGGDCVVTAASGVNQTGNNTLTFNDAGDFLQLQSVLIAGSPRWRIVANDGVTLTTV